MRRALPVHRLRPNHSEWSPPAVIYLDTETRSEVHERGELHRLRLWCARLDDRRPGKHKHPASHLATGETAWQLVEQVQAWMRGRSTVWLYCHNLAFDLTTTRLPDHLSRLGWDVTAAAISGTAPWVRLAKGSKRLALCDSWSWLPASLASIGAQVGQPKLPLPAQGDDDAAWRARCWSDVHALAQAVGSLLDWWDREQLGHWSITGAACGWNAYRHTPTAQEVVIDQGCPHPAHVKHGGDWTEQDRHQCNPVGVRDDRSAVYGGRRGVWRVGEHRFGPFAEIDFKAAYNTVPAHLLLPWKRSHRVAALDLDDPRLSNPRLGFVGHVQVETDVARWPIRWRGAVWYPVGAFTTVLAQPDLDDALRLGCVRSVGSGWMHRLGDAMRWWAQWNLDVTDGIERDAPPAARLAAKHWGRAVIGKWSAHGHDRYPLGPSCGAAWGYLEGWTLGTGRRGGVTMIGGTQYWSEQTDSGDNTYPAVHAFVEAHVRTRLNRVIEALGPRAVLQADTDGLIVNCRTVGTHAARGHLVAPAGLSATGRLNWCLDQLEPVYSPLVLRVKRTFSHVTVHGPQHLRVEGERRYSGVGKQYKETSPNVFTGLAWPGLAWQLTRGNRDGYLRPAMTATVKGPYATGWVLEDGSVVPVQAYQDTDGTTQVAAWGETAWRYPGARLADRQHPSLADLSGRGSAPRAG